MRRLTRLFVFAVLALGGAHGAHVRAQAPGAAPRAVPGELIVKFRPGVVSSEKFRVRARIAAAALAELARTPAARARGSIELLRIANTASLQVALAILRSDPAVEFVEPNWIYTPSAPNDPSFGQQWALENIGQSVAGRRGTADADIDAEAAWAVAPGAPGVYIGVIDQGIDVNHPDLGSGPGGAIWTNPFDPVDGVDNDGNGYVDDIHGWDFDGGDNSVYDGSPTATGIDAHGTHVAGTIGARTGNGLGVAGVSPGVVIIPAKFLGVAGGTTAHAILAVDYLTDLKVRHNLNIVATNNSWSGGGYSQGLLEAIGRAARQNILFIVASGNGGADEIADNNDNVPTYPSNYDTTAIAGYDAVIAVTATGQSDEPAPWGNYGLASVDLAAPGSLILSTAPQGGYSYSSGTSMATPHVSGAAALANAARGLAGAELKAALLAAVDQVAALNGRTVTGGRLNLARAVASGASGTGGSSERTDLVLYAAQADTVAGNWAAVADPTAAGGARMQSANLGNPKIATALVSPSDYFELSFEADAGRPYHLWLRGRAEQNGWANDSVHVQFDGSVDAGGSPIYRIATTGAAEINLEDCSGCGLSGWGWQDNGYGAGVSGPAIYFAASGAQRLRVQIREDGLGVDQIVLSSGRYLAASPGALRGDGLILQAAPGGPSPATREVVLHAADATVVSPGWVRTADAGAAGGVRLQNGNAGAPKSVPALADPADYFELTFRADAGRPYRLWIRGRATGNSWANDSVHVQFSDSVTAGDAPAWRIGTTSSAEVNLEDCSGCGLAGWGWQDNGYGAGVLGPEIRFATGGTHTIRIQVREDGFGIDQIVLSAFRYLAAPPGALKNDGVVLARTGQ